MPAFKSHKTAISDGAWDGPVQKTRVKTGRKRAYYGRIYAWFDPDGEEGVKGTYKFIHHEVGEDGTPGPANLTACSTGIGVLNGGRGGTTIPAADRRGVWTHLAAHLQDADKEAPPLQSLVGGDYPQVFEALQDRAWAVHPAKLVEINAFVENLLDGGPFPARAAAGRSGARAADAPYEAVDGVAVLPIMGVLAKRMNLLTDMSGGTSYELLGKQFDAALADPNITAILLDIDSPGGTVDGVKPLADRIFAARQVKPVVAYGDGLMASAAYWLGSAANWVMAGDTALVGSIGVAAMHYDRSGADAQRGVKRTVISSGKFKRLASDTEPLSAEGLQYLQEISDTYYQIFLEAVGRQRGGITALQVHEHMADGREFVGRQALDKGLLDGIGTKAQAIAKARRLGRKNQTGGKDMDLKTLQAQHPEVFEEIKALGASEAAEVLRAEGWQDGLEAERIRVLKILRAGGKADLTLAAVEQGDAPEAALEKFLQAERDNRNLELEKMKQAAPGSMGQQAMGGSETFETRVAGLLAQGQAKTRGEAIRIVARQWPELHQDYIDRQNSVK